MMPRHLAPFLVLGLALGPSIPRAEATAGVSAPFGPEVRKAARDGVPVRPEPGFVHRELGFLSKDQQVVVDGRQGRWFHVQPDGWVFEEHLVASAGLPACTIVTLVVTQDGAHVRERPSEEAASRRTLAVDEIVRARTLTDGWWELLEGGFVAEAGVHEPGAHGGEAGWVVGAESANVRASASVQAAVVRKLARGDRVLVTRVADGWCQVEGGFVRADLLVAPAAGHLETTEPFSPAADRGLRWGFMDLGGTSFTIDDINDSELLMPVRAAMAATGLMETDWTYLGLTIAVPPEASHLLHFDPSYNSVVAVDQSGEKYGSLVVDGPMEELPEQLRALFVPLQVGPGESTDALLLFVPSLKPKDIREISMLIDGRLQPFYPLE